MTFLSSSIITVFVSAYQLNCCFGLCVNKTKTANIRKMLPGSLDWLSKEAPADHDTKTYCLNPI